MTASGFVDEFGDLLGLTEGNDLYRHSVTYLNYRRGKEWKEIIDIQKEPRSKKIIESIEILDCCLIVGIYYYAY